MEEWQKSVVTAADQCIPLRDVECELPFQPRRQVLNLLEKPGLQLIARRNPPYWTEYYGYGQPRYQPETYTVTARKSSSFIFGEVDHSKQ